MSEHVVLVDVNDQEIGVMDKIEAHEKGKLHRAFSLFILNNDGQMLLQQRALSKYHSPGLWTNACCSHPRQNETPHEAVIRRTQEELNITINPHYLFSFTYQEKLKNGMVEHEFDHVFVAKHHGSITPNPEEVMDYCYQDLQEIEAAIKSTGHDFTVWFILAFPKFLQAWKQHKI